MKLFQQLHRRLKAAVLKRPCRVPRLLGIEIFLLAAGVLLAPAWSNAATKLRYEFEPGRKLMYEVKVVATLADSIETREGSCTYEVKSIADGNFILASSGALTTSRKPTGQQGYLRRPDFLSRFPWADNPFVRPGDFTLSAQGRIIKTSVGTPLPYMLGDLEFLQFEEWPADAKTKWEQKREVTITQRQRSRFPTSPFSPFQDPNVNRSAQEKVTFSVLGATGSNVRLRKEYLLRSEELVDGSPMFELAGEGDLVFDAKQGLLQSQLMKYTFRYNENNFTLRIPLVVECRLLEPQQTAARLKAQEEARTAAITAAAKANEPKPLDAGERDKLLRDLKDRNEWTVRNAADRLAKAPSDGSPEVIANALTPLLADRNGWIRAAAAKALVNWGTTNVAPALVAAAQDPDLWVRKGAMEALGRLKTTEGAKAVAARLVELGDRGDAAKALKSMGCVAEDAVLPFLKDRDGWVRLEACKVLGEIGTSKSLSALEEFGSAGQGFDKPESDKAIKAIRGRQ